MLSDVGGVSCTYVIQCSISALGHANVERILPSRKRLRWVQVVAERSLFGMSSQRILLGSLFQALLSMKT